MRADEVARSLQKAFDTVPFPYKKENIENLTDEANDTLEILKLVLTDHASDKLRSVPKPLLEKFWEDYDDLMSFPEEYIRYVLPRLMALTVYGGCHDVFDIENVVRFLNLSGYTASVVVKRAGGTLAARSMVQDMYSVAQWYAEHFPPLNKEQIEAVLNWLDFMREHPHPDLKERGDELTEVRNYWRNKLESCK